jgi:RHS repeat-associated protein
VDNTGNTTLNDGTIVAADMMQINHYYPFGMNMEGNWNGLNGKNKYQYNEKELNSDFGLDLSDYGARFYDAAIGRFPSVDPLSAVYARQTPYAYAANNPATMIDYMGMGPAGQSADGMTNEQWVNASNPAGKGSEAASSAYRGSETGKANYEKSKASSEQRSYDYQNTIKGEDIAASYTVVVTDWYKKVLVNGVQQGDAEYLGSSASLSDCECGCPGKPDCPPPFTNPFTRTISGISGNPWANASTAFGLTAGAFEQNLQNQKLQKINSFNNMRAPYEFQVGQNTKSYLKWARYSTFGSYAGKALGVWGIITTLSDVVERKKTFGRAGVDLGVLYLGTRGGWIGIGVSTVYFASRGIWDYNNPGVLTRF